MDLRSFYNISGLVSAVMVILGDVWLSLDTESMKYAFMVFLVANTIGAIHYYIVRANVVLMLPLILMFTSGLGIYNYFDDSIFLAVTTTCISFLLTSIGIAYIYKNKILLDIKDEGEVVANAYYEYSYTAISIVGMILIALNEQYTSFSGFALWLIFTPVGFMLAKSIKSKGLMLQVLAYIPIEIIGIFNYSNYLYEPVTMIFVAFLMSLFIILKEKKLDRI